MRIIYLLITLCAGLIACTGDCRSCHQNLDYKNDARHAPMLECKSCHTDEKMASIDMGGCGEDCFACHDIQKIQSPALAKEHNVINSCMGCHAGLKNSPLNTGVNVFQKGFKNFSDALVSPTQ